MKIIAQERAKVKEITLICKLDEAIAKSASRGNTVTSLPCTKTCLEPSGYRIKPDGTQ